MVLPINPNEPLALDADYEYFHLRVDMFADAGVLGPDQDIDIQILSIMGPKGALAGRLGDEGPQIDSSGFIMRWKLRHRDLRTNRQSAAS